MIENIPSHFLATAEKHSDSIAFHHFHGEWKTLSYGEFVSLAKSISKHLIGLGAEKGDRIAIISENRPEWCAAYMGILFCRCIAVPVDMQLGPQEIRNIVSDSGAKVVFHSAKTAENVSNGIKDLGVKAADFDSIDFSDAGSFEPATDADASDIASIIYTSGTTGNPKGVMLTHMNFCSDAEALVNAELVSARDNVLSVLPLHHTYPFMCTFILPVFLGGSVTFSPGLKAAELIPAIRDRGATVVLGVPRLFEMIRNGIVTKISEKKKISGLLMKLMKICGKIRRSTNINLGKIIFGAVHENFRKVRFFASGGARLEPAVMEDLEALGFTMLEGYGLTETSPVIAFNPLTKRKPGSTGCALPGIEIRIADGEITVKGPMVMAGYYKNTEATQQAIKEGFFYTGDLGHIDDEGYLFITGRKKEVIVLSSGKNIYPEDVEKAYMHIPLIKEIAVTGLETRGAVDFIQAIVVPDLDYAKRMNIGNISEALRWELNDVTSKLPEYMRIKGFTLSSEPLPRTPLGKLRRFMLKDILNQTAAAKKEVRTADEELMRDETGRIVAGCIEALLDEKIPLRSGDNLELDLGFDSLKKIEFISALEDAFSISIPETFISDVQTIGDVVSAIQEYAGEGARKSGGITWKEILEKELPEEDRRKADFVHGPLESVIIFIIFMSLKIFCKIFFRLSVRGIENIPAQGPYLLAANHSSYLDGFVVGAAVPYAVYKRLSFLGISKFFAGNIKQFFARISHVIPIDAEKYLNRALQMSAYLLRQGKGLCIFPEGGRSFGTEVMEFKKGVGIIAIENKIPVIPVYISGANEALPRGAAFIKPARIEITLGKPFTINDLDVSDRPSNIDEYQFFADQLRERVIALSRSQH